MAALAWTDQLLARLHEEAFVSQLLNDVGLGALFAQSYELEQGELKELQLAAVQRREMAMAVFETQRSVEFDERLGPAPERHRIDRQQPRAGRLCWVDLFLELRLSAKVDPKTARLKEITSRELLLELGNPADLAQLRAALQARYGASVVEAAFKELRILSFEEFRRRAPRFLRFVSDPPVPYDPQDPQNQRTYPLCVCLKAQPLPLVGEALHEAKLCRSVLEHERRHEELFQDGEIERPYVFVTVFPDEAIGNDALPGMTAAQAKARIRALFAAEGMLAHFVAL